jgi:hypothetical protein
MASQKTKPKRISHVQAEFIPEEDSLLLELTQQYGISN